MQNYSLTKVVPDCIIMGTVNGDTERGYLVEFGLNQIGGGLKNNMIIKYISCDELMHEGEIGKVRVYQHYLYANNYFIRCYRSDSKDDYFDLNTDKLISITNKTKPPLTDTTKNKCKEREKAIKKIDAALKRMRERGCHEKHPSYRKLEAKRDAIAGGASYKEADATPSLCALIAGFGAAICTLNVFWGGRYAGNDAISKAISKALRKERDH